MYSISKYFKNIFEKAILWFHSHPYARETFWVTIRLALMILIPVLYAFIGGWLFEPINSAAANSKPIFNHNSFRYILFPLAAVVIVIIAGSTYVQDIYLLKTFKSALFYVLSSMFGFSYPQLTIDKGKKEIQKGEENPIEAVGGPGFVNIQPGNAAFSKFLRVPSGIKISRSVFLGTFETIGPPVSLDDQAGHVDEFASMTKDGIEVVLKDINFRFRLIYKKNTQRTPEDPYPFAEDALKRRSANQVVNDQGLVPWDQSIRMAVTTAITNYVNAHTIDFLTAPRHEGKHPREDFRQAILKGAKVWSYGADLLWIDVGHLHIVSDDVDQTRVDLWATEWKGSAEITRAYGEAKHQAYQELGRAEAQAELIISIAQALQEASVSANPAANVRTLLLARTAQILESMETLPKEEKGEKK